MGERKCVCTCMHTVTLYLKYIQIYKYELKAPIIILSKLPAFGLGLESLVPSLSHGAELDLLSGLEKAAVN